MTATDTSETAPAPAVASKAPLSRAVIWLGLAAGTAITVLAVWHGIRFPGLQVVLSVIVTWLLLIVVAVTVTELLRRHHRAMARHGARHGKRGALFAARHAGRGGRAITAKAADRWQRRHPQPAPSGPEPLTFPVKLTARSKSGKPINPVTREPVDSATVYDQEDLGRRLAAAERYPDIEVTVTPIRQDGETVTPPGGENTMPDTKVVDDGHWIPPKGSPADTRSRRRAATTDATYSAEWKAITGATADFEPEDDGHLLQWMAAEVNGMSAYAEALTEVYETCVNTLGLDPVAMQATHDVADAAAESASAMAAARAKFAAHYAEVRQFAANGGLLPFNGRWVTGEGDA